MYKLLLVLSGEHPSLPAAEVKAVLEAENCNFKVVHLKPPIMIIEIDRHDICKILEKRLAMTMEGTYLLFSSNLDITEIEKALREIDLSFLEGKTIAVRILRKAQYYNVRSLELERKLGAIVLEKTKNVRVNLKSPDIVLRGIIADAFYFGVRAFEVDRGSYDLRRPRYRPFFHPGSLEPRVCRLFVNLARSKEGSTFLDPFSGTGGFTIEASMIGCQVVGLDIDDEMCHGSLRNLNALECQVMGIVRGDARKLPFREGSIESIATDPPYGRSTSLKKAALEELIHAFLQQAEALLKRGCYVCIAHPSWLADLKIPNKLRLVEQHEMRVHKSLTRKITVLRRV
ncbi:MAG: RsmD family RNA methyltransferase [Candidatus Nezhaarchaeales archaeon]